MSAAPTAAPTRFTAYSRPTVSPAVGALRTIARTRNGSDMPMRNVGTASGQDVQQGRAPERRVQPGGVHVQPVVVEGDAQGAEHRDPELDEGKGPPGGGGREAARWPRRPRGCPPPGPA